MCLRVVLLVFVCAGSTYWWTGTQAIVDSYSSSLLGESYLPTHSVQAPRKLASSQRAWTQGEPVARYGRRPSRYESTSVSYYNNDGSGLVDYQDRSNDFIADESGLMLHGGSLRRDEDTENPHGKYENFWKQQTGLSDHYENTIADPLPQSAALIGKSGLDVSVNEHARNPWSFYDKPVTSKAIRVYDERDGYYKVYQTQAAKQNADHVYQNMYKSYVTAPKPRSYQTYDKRILKSHAKSLPSYYAEKMGKMLTKRIVDANRGSVLQGQGPVYKPVVYNDDSRYYRQGTVATLPVIHPDQSKAYSQPTVRKTQVIPSFQQQKYVAKVSPVAQVYSPQNHKYVQTRPRYTQTLSQPPKYRKTHVKLLSTNPNSISGKKDVTYVTRSKPILTYTGKSHTVARKPVIRYTSKSVAGEPVLTYLKQGNGLSHGFNDIHYKLEPKQQQDEVIGPTSRNPYATDSCKDLPEGDYVLQGSFITLFPYARPLCSFVKCSNFRAHLNPCSTGTKNYENGTGFCSVLDLVGHCGYSMNSGHSV